MTQTDEGDVKGTREKNNKPRVPISWITGMGVVRATAADDLARTDGTGGVRDFAYHGGPVINTPKVYVLFVGDWTSPADLNRAERLTEFTSDLLNSEYMNVLSQYGCGTSGTVVGPVFIPSGDANLSAKDIRGILQAAIRKGTIPEPDRRTVCLLFLDNRTVVNDEVAGAVMCARDGDTAFGYHHFFLTTAGNPCYFAVVPGLTDACLEASCPGDDVRCALQRGSQSQEQRQTQVASHELSEVLTNPKVGIHEAWTARGDARENGDICNGKSGEIAVGDNAWTVQLTYSKLHDMYTSGETTCIASAPTPLPPLIDP